MTNRTNKNKAILNILSGPANYGKKMASDLWTGAKTGVKNIVNGAVNMMSTNRESASDAARRNFMNRNNIMGQFYYDTKEKRYRRKNTQENRDAGFKDIGNQ